MPHKNKKIDQSISAMVKTMNSIEDAGAKDLLRQVDEMRRAVVLVLVDGGEISPNTSSQLKARTMEIIERYRSGMSEHLSINQRKLFVKGIQMLDAALKAGDVSIAVPYVSEQLLEQARNFGADLITGVTDGARRNIAQQIDLAVLGQKPVNDVVKEIGRNLNDASVFGTVARRAETIFRTEVGRIGNMATLQRMKQVTAQVPDLQKEWLHSHRGIPRPGHLLLDGVTIAVDAKFDLVAKDGTPYKVDGPKDPLLPVGEVVNCGCFLTPVVKRYAQEAS